MKEFAKKFYQSAEWQRTRLAYLQSVNNLCERCEQNNILKLAEIVHHKIYLTKDNINDPAVALNPMTLEALCIDCHNKEHLARQTQKRYKFDERGVLIGIPPIKNF